MIRFLPTISPFLHCFRWLTPHFEGYHNIFLSDTILLKTQKFKIFMNMPTNVASLLWLHGRPINDNDTKFSGHIARSNSTSDRTLALPVQRYTTGHRLTLPRRSQTCHEYFCSQKMLKMTKMLPQ